MSSVYNIPAPGTRSTSPGIVGLSTGTYGGSLLYMRSGHCTDRFNKILISSINPQGRINALKTGANGIDSGSLEPNKDYFVYAIGSSIDRTKGAGIISKNSEVPYLPEGYDAYRIIDIKNTDGSGAFVPSVTLQFSGLGSSSRKFVYVTPKVIGSSIAVGTSYGDVSIAEDIMKALPSNVSIVDFLVEFTPTNNGDCIFLSSDSLSTQAMFSASSAGVKKYGKRTVPIIIDGPSENLWLKSNVPNTVSLSIQSFTFEI